MSNQRAGTSRRAKFDGNLAGPSDSTSTSIPLPPGITPPPTSKDKGKQRSEGGGGNRKGGRPPRRIDEDAADSSSNDAGAEGGAKGSEPTKAAKAASEAAVPAAEALADEGTCFICAFDVQYWSVGECNHRACHKCCIRMRALLKDKKCAYCKTDCARVIITKSPSATYSSFTPEKIPFSDSRLGMSFETRSQYDDSLSLLRFNCPFESCTSALGGWGDLKRHVKSEHKVSLCDLCTSNKKLFSHEHKLYSSLELSAHMPSDHAQCGFCRTWFYDAEALYSHCKTNHEECFLCVKQGIKHQYHLNYAKLEEHFKDVHCLCPHPTCLEQKFVVFASELDLQAHALETHGTSIQGDQRARRDARRIETNFTYDDGPSGGTGRRGAAGPSGSGGGRGGGGGAGGRRQQQIPESSATFVTSSTPAVGTSSNLAGRRFVPGLGRQPEPPTSGRSSANGATTPRDEPPHVRSNGPSRGASRDPSRSASPILGQATAQGPKVSEATAEQLERHAALLRRVQDEVSSENKVISFKAVVRGYHNSELSAPDLVDTLWNMLGNRVESAGPIITGLADLVEGEKSTQLLAAWQDLRARQQNQFPSLTPMGAALAPPSRPPSSNLNGRRPTTPGTSNATAFPALSASSSSNVVGLNHRPVQRSSTAWASSGPGSITPPTSNSASPRLQPTSVSARSNGTIGKTVVRQAEFPGLPPSSAAESRARMMAALGKGSAASTVASGSGGWGASSGSSTPLVMDEASASDAPIAGPGGGKKQKAKKIQLMTLGGIQRG
ncbi:hypothetical protein T439DRAFT_329161 [Meredithblackwellia eburnea MCA 4105]